MATPRLSHGAANLDVQSDEYGRCLEWRETSGTRDRAIHIYRTPVEVLYQFETNDTRIFYRNTYVYHFNESLSCPNCSLDQVVVIPNVLFQKLVDFAAYGVAEQIAVKAALTIAKRETPFLNVTVREALFEGYKDPLLEIACGYPVIKRLCEAAKIPTRIGFFYGKNNTDDGLYEVSTGLGDAFTIGKVFTFNNMSIMPDTTWDSADARQIRGTDGQLFPPMLEEGRDLEIFAGPMCRSIPMEFRGRSEFEGIAAFRYGFPSKMFDPSVPENRGFCNKNNTPTFYNASIQIPGCLPKGLLDISRCVPGAPRIYVSNSHFFSAHPEVQSSIKGMAVPNEYDDQTLVDVEPTSGVPIFAKRATQINVGMVHGNLDLLAKMPNFIMPVLWMNETAAFDSDTRSQLSGLTSIKHIVYVVGVSFLTVGLLMLFAVIVAVVLQTVLKPRGEEEESIIQDVDVEEEVGDI